MALLANVLLLVVLVCCSICVNCYVKHSLSRNTCLFGKSTLLKSQLHEFAEAGDLEALKELIEKDPKLVSKYDIDGL